MKKTFINFKNQQIKIAFLLAMAIVSMSCDDQEVDIPGTADTAAFIAKLTGGSEKVWKIEKATLRNGTTVALDVTEEYTIKDDLFVISSSSNNTIELKWERGLLFKPEATDVQGFNTDERASATIQTLNYLGRDNAFRNNAANYYLEYDELAEKINGTIFLSDDAKIDVILSEKRLEDYLQAPLNVNTTSLLFELQRGSLWAGMKYSRANSTLFLNTPSLPWTGTNLEIFTAAFNTSTGVLSRNQFIEVDDHPWTNLEVINDVVYNVGGKKIQAFDNSFGMPISEFTVDIPNLAPLVLEYGSSSVDGNIYIFGGSISSQDVSDIAVFTPGTQNTGEVLKTLPIKLPFADGEVVGDILYIFGGRLGVENGPNPNNFKYNLITGELSSFEMPVAISLTSTAVVQNLIYVAGRRSLDTNGDGSPDTQRSYLGVYDTVTGTFSEIPLDFITDEDEHIYKVDATEDFIYTGFWLNKSGTDNDSFRVYVSEI